MAAYPASAASVNACAVYFARGKAIRALRGVTTNEKALLYTLHTWADAEGRCFPSWVRLAEDTGLNRVTVSRLLAHLEGLGYVVIDRGRGRGHFNGYRLTLPHPAAPERDEKRLQAAPEKVAPGPEKVASGDGKGCTAQPELTRRTSQLELSTREGASTSFGEHAPPPLASPPSEPGGAPGLALERVPSDLYERIRGIGLGGVRPLPTPQELEAERAQRLREAEAEAARRAG